jgi:hypothetical protein
LEEGGFVLEEEGGAWLAAFTILVRVEVRDPREVFLDMVGKRAMEKSEEKEKKRKKMTRRRNTSSAVENYRWARELGLTE